MKKAGLNLLLLMLLFLSFTSCDDDGYSLGDLYVSLATVEPLSENSYYLVLDNGKTMWDATGFPYKPKSDQRVIAYYTILSDGKDGDKYNYYIKIRGIQEILTKKVIDLTEANQDSIGNDPVKISRYWIGDDYLNMEFSYDRSGNKTHYINLVNNTLEEADPEGRMKLEFRHNANEDPQRNRIDGIVAFDLRPYKTEGKDSVEFLIKVNDFDGEKEYKIVYKFNTEKAIIHLDENENYDYATQYK